MGVGGGLDRDAGTAGRAVVVLAGGTGGAKLARGMADAAGAERLTVIANTGDDIEIYGAHVSPDPDLVSFWLADSIDERGWGLRDDTFAVMDALRDLGRDVWFNLGDRDLAWCVERARMLGEGATPTAALARLCAVVGVRSRVLPMCDEPVRTWVCTEASGWRPFQEFMIRWKAQGPVTGVEFRGAEEAAPSAAVLGAITSAQAIVVGPSNPIASIAPMLAVPGMRAALREAPAPVVAVSPIVGGEVLKGPTAAFMEHAGYEVDAAGVAGFYGDLLDGIVCDEEPPATGPEGLRTDTRMDDAAARAGLAERTLAFAASLAAG